MNFAKNTFIVTFGFAIIGGATALILSSCGDSADSGLKTFSSLKDYQSIKDAEMPTLTANQALILREAIDETTLLGGAALQSSAVAKSLGSIQVIVSNDLGNLFKADSQSKSESVTLDETRNCSKGGQFHGTGTGSGQITKSSATAATTKADESGSLSISACKTAKDVILDGSLQVLGQQNGSLNRGAAVTEYSANPDKYSIDYQIAMVGTIKGSISGEAHTVTFKDFGVAFSYTDAKAQENSALPWDPLSGQVYNAHMAFYSNLLLCRGTVQIDDKAFPCGSIVKFGVDHEIKGS